MSKPSAKISIAFAVGVLVGAALIWQHQPTERDLMRREYLMQCARDVARNAGLINPRTCIESEAFR